MLRGYAGSMTICAAIAQLVERIHGKDEVSGSSPDRGSRMFFIIDRQKCRSFLLVLVPCPNAR